MWPLVITLIWSPPLTHLRGDGQTVVKRWSNSGKTVVKQWRNGGTATASAANAAAPRVLEAPGELTREFGQRANLRRGTSATASAAAARRYWQHPALVKYWSNTGQILDGRARRCDHTGRKHRASAPDRRRPQRISHPP